MTRALERRVIVIIAASICVLLALAFGIGRCSAPTPNPFIAPAEIDAGPGEAEIAARFDASVRAEDERLAALEAEHALELAALTKFERVEYEKVRARGRSALASWLTARSRRLLDGGL